MDVQKDFEVTGKAGAWVAGRRSPGAGKTLRLTEAEAAYALASGELRIPGSKPRAPKKAKAEDAVPASGTPGA